MTTIWFYLFYFLCLLFLQSIFLFYLFNVIWIFIRCKLILHSFFLILFLLIFYFLWIGLLLGRFYSFSYESVIYFILCHLVRLILHLLLSHHTWHRVARIVHTWVHDILLRVQRDRQLRNLRSALIFIISLLANVILKILSFALSKFIDTLFDIVIHRLLNIFYFLFKLGFIVLLHQLLQSVFMCIFTF